MGNKIDVSVVVPCYNAAGPRLDRAVKSALSQDAALEAVLVDDGSADMTLSQIRAWARRDPRVHALHQENGGVSRARNAGVDAAQGEWVAFLDCDDRLEDGALQDMLARADESVDIVLGSYTALYQDGRVQRFDPAPGGRKEVIDSLLRGDSALPSMCARLYRRAFLMEAGVRAPADVRIGEDVLFNLDAFYAARGWSVVPRSVYTYLLREGSAMDAIREQHYAAQADMLAGIACFLARHGLETVHFRAHLDAYLRQLRCDRGRLQAALTFGREASQAVCAGVNPSKLSGKEKIYFMMARYAPGLTYFIP